MKVIAIVACPRCGARRKVQTTLKVKCFRCRKYFDVFPLTTPSRIVERLVSPKELYKLYEDQRKGKRK